MTRHLPPAPAVLDATESPRWIRRGSQAEVLAALRNLLNGSSGGDSDPRWRRKPEKPASVASAALASGTVSTPVSGYATGMSRDDDGDVGRGNYTGMATRHHDAQPVQFRPAVNPLSRPAVDATHGVAAGKPRRAAEVTPYESVTTTATSAAARGGCQ